MLLCAKKKRSVPLAEQRYDFLTPAARSELMSKIGGRNTRPEIVVRSLLHKIGFRFRLHVKGMAGKPDIVLPRYKTVIFVHGCFWHGHSCAKGVTLPKTRKEFWTEKIARTKERDKENIESLHNLGWRVIVVWECELKNPLELAQRMEREILA